MAEPETGALPVMNLNDNHHGPLGHYFEMIITLKTHILASATHRSEAPASTASSKDNAGQRENFDYCNL